MLSCLHVTRKTIRTGTNERYELKTIGLASETIEEKS